MKRIVMFSGGVGSWATARRVADEFGTKDMTLLFADVKGDNPSPHAGEDEDTYRFIEDAAEQIGAPLVVLNEGRDIWQVFKDDRFLGNSRLANCSKFLKQKPCRKWLDENCDPEETVVYVGIDWSETHRVNAIVKAYVPYKAEAPMTNPPYLSKDEMFDAARAAGLVIPRAYGWGMSHNNCGGGCVRAGQAQFELLLRVHPERYAYWEKKEQEVRDHLEKDVTILRKTVRGEKIFVTLKDFRLGLQEQPSMFDEYDIGGCGCFVEGEE